VQLRPRKLTLAEVVVVVVEGVEEIEVLNVVVVEGVGEVEVLNLLVVLAAFLTHLPAFSVYPLLQTIKNLVSCRFPFPPSTISQNTKQR
jgi:hypothetical protein